MTRHDTSGLRGLRAGQQGVLSCRVTAGSGGTAAAGCPDGAGPASASASARHTTTITTITVLIIIITVVEAAARFRGALVIASERIHGGRCLQK